MYNFKIYHLYIKLCVYHPSFSLLLISHIWPPLPSLISPIPFPSANHHSVSMSLFVYCFLFHISHIGEITWFLSFSTWHFHLTFHDILKVHPCCCKWQYFIIFYGWVVFYYMATTNKTISSVREDVDKRKPLYTADRNVSWCSLYGKQYGDSPPTLRVEQTYNPVIPFLAIYPQKCENT